MEKELEKAFWSPIKEGTKITVIFSREIGGAFKEPVKFYGSRAIANGIKKLRSVSIGV